MRIEKKIQKSCKTCCLFKMFIQVQSIMKNNHGVDLTLINKQEKEAS